MPEAYGGGRNGCLLLFQVGGLLRRRRRPRGLVDSAATLGSSGSSPTGTVRVAKTCREPQTPAREQLVTAPLSFIRTSSASAGTECPTTTPSPSGVWTAAPRGGASAANSV